jgi:carbon monoxide dehydrogenase subunit G
VPTGRDTVAAARRGGFLILASSCYVIDYAGRFSFEARPEAVWTAIEHLDQFERWWGWLGSLKVDGDGLTAGSILEGTVSPPLPYRMRVRVELLRCVPAQLIDAAVHGDLEGTAHLTLEAEGQGTRADASWTIEMMQRPMRIAARVAHPVLRWGHDMVVDATVRGFNAHVREVNDPGAP